MAHVLIVDDDEDIRLAMRTLLEDIAGHTVDEAADGQAALDLLRASEERYVVLLDLLMPRLDGLEVLQRVAADERLAARHAYVLVTVSRKAESADFAASLALAVSVVPKPYDMDVLLETVSEASRQIQGELTP